MFNRVVIPLDGSEVAEEALDMATELATRLGTQLKLVRIVDTYRSQSLPATGMALDYSMLSELAAEEIDDARAYLDARISFLKEKGLDVTGDVLHGPIARQIVASADAEDVIVMSSHGRTGLKRWFLGSVAEEVMRHANCPILLHRSHNIQHGED